MANSLDIDLIPLYRRAGQDAPAVPGLLIANKPRRTARSREADQLILYLALTGNVTLPLDMTDRLLAELVRTYYDTNGSVTAALRSTAESLNQVLLKRNMQSAAGQQVIGLLTLATLRGDQLYLAQSGPVYAFYLTAGQAQELYDPALSGRGLGTGQSTPLRYFSASLQPRDMLVLSAHPSPNWNVQTLGGLYGQDIDYQQRRLLDQAVDANAVLLSIKPGSGRVALITRKPGQQPAKTEQSAAGVAPAQPAAAAAPLPPVDDQTEDLIRTQAMLDQYQPLPEIDTDSAAALPLTSEAISYSSAARAEPAPAALEPAAVSQPTRAKTPAAPGAGKRIGRTLRGWLGRLLPEESLAAIPNSVMAVMAVVVPLVIVAMATAVYFQRGLAAQSEIAYNQAVQAVQQAQSQTEPTKRRTGLDDALRYLEAADSYRKLPATQSLRLSILADLDGLDLVRRLDYQPAIVGGLPEGAKITRIVNSDSDIYLLDSQSGKVIRAFSTNQGYQIDPAFQCGPGIPANVGPLIDLSPWSMGSDPTASVVAMDANGMLLFCSPDSAPQPKKLPNSPAGELKDLKGFALNFNDLYVLDPVANSVWVYWSGDFNGEPAYYFGDQPAPLQDVIDLAATNEDLYLLHADGHMTLCVTGQLGVVTPTRCTDPAPYIDMRPGQESLPLSPVPAYSQLQYSPPPDPSLYFLEPADHAVDRYSLRNLAYQSRYLPMQSLGSGATAAWVDSVERLIFIAEGNRVYYANLP